VSDQLNPPQRPYYRVVAWQLVSRKKHMILWHGSLRTCMRQRALISSLVKVGAVALNDCVVEPAAWTECLL
jgi:hypothetical protein